MRMDLCLRGMFTLALLSAVNAAADSEPSAIFAKKCASCHTFGKGDLVGPDLKGVNERHPRAWLLAWIRSSENVICLLYTSPSPRDGLLSRMPSSA